MAPIIRNLASIGKPALPIAPAVLLNRNEAIFFKSKNRKLKSFFIYLFFEDMLEELLKEKSGETE